MADVKEIELEPGYHFAPGYYRDFWVNKIEKVFSDEVKNKHVTLKPYREVWVGSIVAAAHSKLTGIKHYVSLPPDEPPDVYITKFENHQYKGKPAIRIETLKVEITRCNMDEGENLFDQITKKNKPAYGGMSLAVYLTGSGKLFDMNDTVKRISGLKKVHLAEILVIGKVEKQAEADLAEGTFAQVFLYPQAAQLTVNVGDPLAFFREPAVLTANKRGVSTDLTSIGTYRIIPPRKLTA